MFFNVLNMYFNVHCNLQDIVYTSCYNVNGWL